ncbi:MAG: adenine-specific methyltransferase EcoRI family protein [Paludibacteraceae bacterium]|nr:adenine-specific methyltransferase EcoRI family protein [Paludibacteraceae bacterium]
MARTDLSNAKKAKQDEFYTQLEDIEKELRFYKDHFNGKVVFCNCDDPYESNFFKYFALHFNDLGLKKLICTCYDGSPFMGNELVFDFDIFHNEASKKAYKVEITEVKDENGDGAIDLSDVRILLQNDKNAISILKGNGDFRSPECVELLKEADIVVTNPPFSLFREYVAQLVEYDKKYIILGNMNAITYRDIFSLIQNNKMWIGQGFNLSMIFKTTYANTNEGNRKYVASKGYNPDDNFVKTPAIAWYTNLDIQKRHEELDLYKSYTPEEYKKYDNYDAINVDKVTDIPCDYEGVMGVPLTFLDKYNPDQFEIIGRTGDIEWAQSECDFFTPPSAERIAKYKKQDHTWRVQNPYFVDETDNVHTIYFRILIRKRSKNNQ